MANRYNAVGTSVLARVVVVRCARGLRQHQAPARQLDSDQLHRLARRRRRPGSRSHMASDGPSQAYTRCERKWLFPSMRRGGKVLYAFNVTNMISTPGSATLMWKIGCPTRVTIPLHVGLRRHGPDWRPAKNVKTMDCGCRRAEADADHGRGYDTCEDGIPHLWCEPKGQFVYVIAPRMAPSGEFTTDRPGQADVFVVPDGIDGPREVRLRRGSRRQHYRISGATQTSRSARRRRPAGP